MQRIANREVRRAVANAPTRSSWQTVDVPIVMGNADMPSASSIPPLTVQEARDFLALLCRVARASGMVSPAESVQLTRARQSVAQDAVSAEDLQAWLRAGPPDIAAPLPAHLKQAFHEAALVIAGQRGHCDPHEITMIEEILQQCFAGGSRGQRD